MGDDERFLPVFKKRCQVYSLEIVYSKLNQVCPSVYFFDSDQCPFYGGLDNRDTKPLHVPYLSDFLLIR
jgi:hypothetical protein